MTLKLVLALFSIYLLGCAPEVVWPPITGDVIEDAAQVPDAAQASDGVQAPDSSQDASVRALDASPDASPDASTDGFDPRDLPRTPEVWGGPTFPTLRVFVDPAWTTDQRRGVWAGLRLLRELVPHVLEVPEATAADLSIYPAEVDDCAVVAGNAFVRTAYVDPRCFPTASGFTFPQAVAHLVLHHLGLRHVCLGPGESRDDCSTVPYGRGLMNVHFAEQRTPARTRLGWTGGLSFFDLAEANRVFTSEPWRFE